MTELSICFCGAQPGFSHDRFCPRPLYNGSVDQQASWLHEYNEAKRAFALEHDVENEMDEHVLDIISQEQNEAAAEEQDFACYDEDESELK